jgi:hypothetical protein
VSSNLLASVYNRDCGALECLQESGDLAMFPTTTFFYSILGESYLVYVYGPRGAFNITLEESEALPNDLCDDAIALTINGAAVAGDTSGSIPEFGLDVCGGSGLGSAGGLWYSFIGNGGRLLLDVSADYDSQLLVFNGSCNNLECVAGNDDVIGVAISGYQSAVEIDSKDGGTYHALGKSTKQKDRSGHMSPFEETLLFVYRSYQTPVL